MTMIVDEKKVINNVINAKEENGNVLYTQSGDFPGMASRTTILMNACISYKDDDIIFVIWK